MLKPAQGPEEMDRAREKSAPESPQGDAVRPAPVEEEAVDSPQGSLDAEVDFTVANNNNNNNIIQTSIPHPDYHL